MLQPPSKEPKTASAKGAAKQILPSTSKAKSKTKASPTSTKVSQSNYPTMLFKP